MTAIETIRLFERVEAFASRFIAAVDKPTIPLEHPSDARSPLGHRILDVCVGRRKTSPSRLEIDAQLVNFGFRQGFAEQFALIFGRAA